MINSNYFIKINLFEVNNNNFSPIGCNFENQRKYREKWK